ncbi:MAG: TolC family protein [Fulvivirga sp.]|nr:TolC family protein [Fulvivirga sp.]
MKKLTFIACLICAFDFIQAQEVDSTVLSYDDFYTLVVQNHPLARQIGLLSEQARANLRMARGNFDPKVGFQWQKKDFGDTEYYDKVYAALKVPTWFGLTPEVGMSQRDGQFLNPEDFISESTDNQQVFAGLNMSLGRGLFIDERRATLAQAKLFTQLTEAEQVKQLNDLLLAAAQDYWNWYEKYYNYEVVNQSMNIAQDIFARTKLAYTYGEVAAIDTVQAKANLLTRKTQLVQSRIDLRESALKLSTYLWKEDGTPLEIRPTTRPQQPEVRTDVELAYLLDLATQQHPELVKLRVKNESLGVERRMSVENLKPRLDVRYVVLDQPVSPEGELSGLDLEENYAFGIDFSFPLLLRKERAKLDQVDLKIEQNNLAQNDKERSIINKINADYFALVNTEDLIDQQLQVAQNYQLLVNAERLNLASGESDLFKLNNQLDKLLESQSKVIKANADYQKLYVKLLWSAGVEQLQLE